MIEETYMWLAILPKYENTIECKWQDQGSRVTWT